MNKCKGPEAGTTTHGLGTKRREGQGSSQSPTNKAEVKRGCRSGHSSKAHSKQKLYPERDGNHARLVSKRMVYSDLQVLKFTRGAALTSKQQDEFISCQGPSDFC